MMYPLRWLCLVAVLGGTGGAWAEEERQEDRRVKPREAVKVAPGVEPAGGAERMPEARCEPVGLSGLVLSGSLRVGESLEYGEFHGEISATGLVANALGEWRSSRLRLVVFRVHLVGSELPWEPGDSVLRNARGQLLGYGLVHLDRPRLEPQTAGVLVVEWMLPPSEVAVELEVRERGGHRSLKLVGDLQ